MPSQKTIPIAVMPSYIFNPKDVMLTCRLAREP